MTTDKSCEEFEGLRSVVRRVRFAPSISAQHAARRELNSPYYFEQVERLLAAYDALSQQSPQGAAPCDLLKALRAAEVDYTLEWGSGDLYGAAADEIEMLRAALASWRSFFCRPSIQQGPD